MTKKKVVTLKIRTVNYSAGQGIRNIFRNKMFSIASIATMTACIFIFGLFFSIIINFTVILKNVETNVGITVFFNEGLDQASINRIGSEIEHHDNVVTVRYVSADDAWDSFSNIYFKDNAAGTEGFRNNNDNPLANSAHFVVYADKIENQDSLVDYVGSLEGVRSVNQSQEASKTLSTINRLMTIISTVIVGILLIVSVFLISNTVAVGISVRKEEIAIMKLIGATNAFVRLPFILEGLVIGLAGAVIPLIILYFLYDSAIRYIMERFSVLQSFMNGLLPVGQVFRLVVPVGLILGMGIGLIGSAVTIHKHLQV